MTNIAIPAEGDRRIPARFYVPSGPRQPKPPLIVYFHGGGFFSGDLDTHDVIRLGSADARTGERLVAIGFDGGNGRSMVEP